MIQVEYRIEKLKSGGYMSYTPSIKPVIVQGDTEEESIEKLKMALGLYFTRHPEVKDEIRTIEV